MKPYLASPQYTAAVINSHKFVFQKRFGQNFLIDGNILDNIMDAAGIEADDFILEIGPGIGTMTQYLAERAARVMAVEIDKSLIPILEDTLAAWNNVTVINRDILKVDIAALVRDENAGRPIKVVANLPYYITTPILMRLLEEELPIESITVMVQTEVAERMKAGPGSKAYGALSLAVQYYATPEIAMHVPPACFMPRPNVGSSVLCLRRRERPAVAVTSKEHLFAVIHAAFSQRRKTLVNVLAADRSLQVSKERALEAVRALGLSDSVRGEALNLEQFAALSERLR